MNKRILFVDDEPMVLQGIERSLRAMRKEWEIEFATSGAEALENLARAHFDVVISDMRMPGMDGAQLLELVKAKYPRAVRIILSGQSDRETILRSVGPTHQYLSKPCDAEELKNKLVRAFALRELLENPRLKEIVGRLDTVPSLPVLYVTVTNALQVADTPISEIGKIIAQDMGMSMKVLQLVNSAFFGLPCQVSSPQQACALIGIDNIKALVLSVHVFSQFEPRIEQEVAVLWKHSLKTAGLAKAIARAEKSSRNLVDDAFAAGLLHDVGRLVLASACPDEFRQVAQQAMEQKSSIPASEQAVLGCTHAQVGAYLLGLWGLPDPVVEGVGWHHEPALGAPTGFSALIAVHAADYYDHQTPTDPSFGEKPALDQDLLAKLALQDRIGEWARVCQAFGTEGKTHV
jgi:HD-like signal output (HDOD) protein